MDDHDVRLFEFSKDEWRDIYFRFKPHATELEYDRDWDEMMAKKEERLLQKGLH